MNTLFEQNGCNFEIQGDYQLPYITSVALCFLRCLFTRFPGLGCANALHDALGGSSVLPVGKLWRKRKRGSVRRNRG